MVARNILSLVFTVTCLLAVGCAGCLNCARCSGACGMCASCGMPEASCACPECGCADPCCGCPEPACGCVDECCDPGCGVPGCGSMVGGRRCFLGTCPLLVRLRNFICGTGCGGGCSCDAYYGDWNCDPPCCEPCDQCGNYTGAQYGVPMSRRPYMANRVQADEIRFADGMKSTRR